MPSDQSNSKVSIDGPPDEPAFGKARTIVIVFPLAWIAIGIEQGVFVFKMDSKV
ncbi:MAG TPA: hypothetical protein VGE97_04620 [Nitrososphaera sp.]